MGGVFRHPTRQLDENVDVARLAGHLAHKTGKVEYRKMAVHTMRYFNTPGITPRRFLPGILLAAVELGGL